MISAIKRKIKLILNIIARLYRAPSYYFNLTRSGQNKRLVYVVENADWSIKWDGIHITTNLMKKGYQCLVETNPFFIRNSIIHYGSSNVFYNYFESLRRSGNKIFVTFFHGDYGLSKVTDQAINTILSEHIDIDGLIVSNNIMLNRFKDWGFPESKIHLVSLGVDTSIFKAISDKKKYQLRNEMGIPQDAIVIGSFQKDGVGWGEGNEPKLIKGPDVFTDVVKRLSKTHTIFCVLTGPARGYVKRELEASGVDYCYEFVDDPNDIPKYYQILDLYLVASREEGGPKAILESMACGIPIVSTCVGMAPDIIIQGKNGYIADIDDIDTIADKVENILSFSDIERKEFKDNEIKTAAQYDWSAIATQYDNIYSSELF